MNSERTLTRRFNTYPRTEVKWLWRPYLPSGKISVIQGDPGDGKTTLALALSALLSTGQPLPESNGVSVSGEILYQSAEDAVGDTLEPRLTAMGADCSKISNISVPFNDIEKDCELIENAIREVGAILFVLDPLQAFIGKGNDMTRAADMRRLMSGLSIVTAKTECAVVAIGHMNKAERSKTLYRGLGSIDIAASARSVLHVGRSADDKDIRVVSHIKSSLAKEGVPIAFTIGDNSTVEFLGRYDGEIKPADAPPVDDTKREIAKDIILKMLTDGAKPCVEIYKECKAAGILSERTVDEAKKELGVKSVRRATGWEWVLD
jgi:energy-coupling factor transporter ATP-binding protein EcfA2